MNAPLPPPATRAHHLAAQVAEACERIAPTWPLDRFIAVNPYWGYVDLPIEETAAQLRTASGTSLLMPRSYYRHQWREGRVEERHLRSAIAAAGATCTVEAVLQGLEAAVVPQPSIQLVTHMIGDERTIGQAMPWRDLVTHQISQHCAAHFDRLQAGWRCNNGLGLYASWRDATAADRGLPVRRGRGAWQSDVRALPDDAPGLIDAAVDALGVSAEHRVAYFSALLQSINGWAAWCAYRRWEARLIKSDDQAIVDLLAIRLAWEWLLLNDCRLQARWHAAEHDARESVEQARVEQQFDWLWQAALEVGYQEPLCRDLAGARSLTAPPLQPVLQAAFCIDVRSEVFRRALEAQAPEIQTLGFAGFFGLPIAYSPLGSALTRPQLPGLLAPALCVSEMCEPPSLAQNLRLRRQRGLLWRQRWAEFRLEASSGFSFVESIGLLYAGKLVKDSLPSEAPAVAWEHTGLPTRAAAALVPRLDKVGPDADNAGRAELALSILRAMSLTTGFARLVLLAGHGSQSANNPHAAGLDCGACGGQTGEVNARVLAALLNEAEVRKGLQERGVTIPASTHFIAGLHNTTTDEVTLFDLAVLPPSHADDVALLQAWLDRAGEAARGERAAALGLTGLVATPERLSRAIKSRANDWAQVRPEWGLADNAAFIVAPRQRTRHLNLRGRAFLHDYRWQDDTDLKVLELIMTAPMVVTNWINLQYYASTVDNRHFGSGNKVLHNVVGGNIGVFEGNGGDLRIGLPWQSLHDGSHLRHTPLRLSVFIEAPHRSIDEIVSKHKVVRQLIENRWLHLFCIDGAEITRYGEAPNAA